MLERGEGNNEVQILCACIMIPLLEYLAKLLLINPNLNVEVNKLMTPEEWLPREPSRCIEASKKVLFCEHLFSSHDLDTEQQTELWELVSKDSANEKNMGVVAEFCKHNGIANVDQGGLIGWVNSALKDLWSKISNSGAPDGPVGNAVNAIAVMGMEDFFKEFDTIVKKWPVLASGATDALRLAQECVKKKVEKASESTSSRIALNHSELLKGRKNKIYEAERDEAKKEALNKLFNDLEGCYEQDR